MATKVNKPTAEKQLRELLKRVNVYGFSLKNFGLDWNGNNHVSIEIQAAYKTNNDSKK